MSQVGILTLDFIAKTGQFIQDLGKASASIEKTDKALKESVRSMNKEMEALGNTSTKHLDVFASKWKAAEVALKSSWSTFNAGLAATAVVSAAAAVVKLGDEYQSLQTRIKGVSNSTKEYKTVSDQLFNISQRNHVALETTAQAFQQIARNAQGFGATNSEVLKLTNAVQQLGVIGGTSGEAMKTAMLQFSQAMGSGTLAGDELKSIMENMPVLADKIAQGIGVTRGELKKMGADGKLTSELVFNAILKQTGEINKEFQKMPVTVNQAMTDLSNSTLRAVGEFDRLFLVSSSTASVLKGMSGSIDAATTSAKNWFDETKKVDFMHGQVVTRMQAIRGSMAFLIASAGRWWAALNGDENAQNLLNMDKQIAQNNLLRKSLQDVIDTDKKLEVQRSKPAPPPVKHPAVDEKALKKAADERERDLKSLRDILDATAGGYQQAKLKAAEDEKGLILLEAQSKVAKLTHLTEKERLIAVGTLNSLLTETAKIEKERASNSIFLKESQQIKEATAHLRAQYEGKLEQYELDKKIAEIKANKALTPEHQEKLIKTVIAEAAETKVLNEKLEDQKKILENVKESSERYEEKLDDLAKALAKGSITHKQYEEAVKQVNDTHKKASESSAKRIADIDDEIGAIEAKRKGLEAEYALQRKILALSANKNLSNEEILKEAAKETQLYEAKKKNLETEEKHKTVLDQVKNGTQSHKEKVDTLNKAYNDLIITEEEWRKSLKDLNDDKLKKVQSSVKSFTGNLLNDLTSAITQGKSLNDVFKNLLVNAAKFGAQKFLFDPISNKASSIASNWYQKHFLKNPASGSGGGAPGTAASNPLLPLSPQTASTSGSNPGGILSPMAASPIGSSPSVAATQQANNFSTLASDVSACKTFTPEGQAFRVKIVTDTFKAPAGFKPLKPYTGSGGSDSPYGGENVVPFLRRFEGMSKGGPAWRVIEPDCPCPPLLKGGSGGSSGGGSATAEAGGGDPNFPMLLAGLEMFKQALKQAFPNLDAGHLKGIAGDTGAIAANTRESANTLRDILAKLMECCMPKADNCACGPGGGGGFGGGIAGGTGGGGAPFYPIGGMAGGPVDLSGGRSDGGNPFNPAFLKGGVSSYVNGGGYSPFPYQPMTPQMGSYGSAPLQGGVNIPGGIGVTTAVSGRLLTSTQTGMALQQANTAANAETAAAYARGEISAQQAQTAYLTRQTAQLTQAASGYRMTPTQAYGPAINNPFILQGSPYAGMMDAQYDDSPTSTPGLTGAIYGLPNARAYGGPSGPQSQLGPYAGWDANSAVARFVGSGGMTSGAESVRNGFADAFDNASQGWKLQPGQLHGIYDWSSFGGTDPNTSAYGGTQLYGAIGQNRDQYGRLKSTLTGSGNFRTPLGFADGGSPPVNVASLVGERGPELFVPKQAGTVVSNENLGAMLNGGASGGAPQISIVNNTGAAITTSNVEWTPGKLKFAVGQLVADAPNNPKAQANMRKNAKGLSRKR